MVRRISSPKFVGRREELRLLLDALERAAAGNAGTVLVSGESGVGKSRLAAEFEQRARGAGALVAVSACMDLGDSELPYAPIVEALRAVLGETDLDDLDDVLEAGRRELSRLLPELAVGDEPGAAGPLAQSRLFGLLLRLLGRIAERDPVAIVVEDVHWADASSRDFLMFLARSARRQRLLLVATYRSEELHRAHPLRRVVAALERDSRVERLQLAPFTRDELDAQVAAILGEPAEPRLAATLYERSEGNAFFAEELLAAVRADDERRLPESVRDALMLRVEGLSEPTQRVLRVAAASGSRTTHGLLAAAAGTTEDVLLTAVREAVARNVLVHEPESGAYAFRHTLLREALYDDLLPGERAAVHARLAEALGRDRALSVAHGAAAALAFHWHAAHRVAPALAASIEAGRDAARVSAFGEAHRHLARALELWEGVPDDERPPGVALVDVMGEAADAAHLAGDNDRAVAIGRGALELWEAAGDPVGLALAHERLGSYLTDSGAMETGLQELREAIRLLPAEPPSAERARVLNAEAQLIMLLTGRGDEMRERCEAAIRIAGAVGARDVEARSRITLGVAHYLLGEDAAAVEQLREGRRIAEAIGLVEELWRADLNLGHVLDGIGRLEEAVAVALEGREIAARQGMQGNAAVLGCEAGKRLMRLGRWREADEVLRDAVESRATGLFGSAVLQARADLDAARGQFEAADAMLRQSREMSLGAGGSMYLAPIASTQVVLELWRGRPEEAQAASAHALATFDVEDDLDMYLALLYAAAARAAADLAARARALGQPAGEHERRADDVHAALRAAEAGAVRPPSPDAAALVRQCGLEAERARGEDDAGGWGALAAQSEARPYAEAYARWREAEAALLRGGERAQAGRALRRAAETARALGARPLLQEVEGLARRARIDLAGGSATEAAAGPAERLGLTAREAEVLALVAGGQTNKEIGAALYMSEKTASVHVSRILGKLGVRSRVEAAGVAHRLGLADEISPAP